MEKKVSAGEASTAEVLDEIKECVHRKQDFLVQRSRTAALWIQYLEMVDILRSFIRAERTANWELHLEALTRMLPYLAASGHNLYVKCARLYLQSMSDLRTDRPDVYRAFTSGLHVARRSDRFWAGCHRTGPYEKSEDRWRLDQREGPNGTATSHLAVINACVCRNKPHHARADGSSVQLWRTEQRHV